MAEHVSGACADLTCYLTWHLRRAWAPLTFTGQEPPQQGNPVTPLPPLDGRQAKASYQHDRAGQPCRGFCGLLEHLATFDPQPGPVHRHRCHYRDARPADQRQLRWAYLLGLRVQTAMAVSRRPTWLWLAEVNGTWSQPVHRSRTREPVFLAGKASCPTCCFPLAAPGSCRRCGTTTGPASAGRAGLCATSCATLTCGQGRRPSVRTRATRS